MSAVYRIAARTPGVALPCLARAAHSQGRHRCCQVSALQTRTSNPAFQYGNFDTAVREAPATSTGGPMTFDGAVGKTAFLLLITLCAASYTWQQAFGMAASGAIVALKGSMTQYSTVGGIGALVCSLATIFKPNWSPYTSPLYAACKGFLLGGMSLMFELKYPGLVMGTTLVTMGTAGGLLAAFKTGMIEVTDRVRSIVTTAIFGVMIAYGLTMLLGLFGVQLAFLSGGPIGIGIGCVTALVAAASMLLDFDAIKQMEYSQAPKWMEWYGGFMVLVSLLWLYMELLRLGAMVAGNRED